MSTDRHQPSMVDEDAVLANAFRSVRSEYDGEREEADLTLQRALFQTRVQKKRQRITRWALLPAAAVLIASTAWAGATGRLPSVSTMLDAIYEGREHTPPAPVPSSTSLRVPTSSTAAAFTADPTPPAAREPAAREPAASGVVASSPPSAGSAESAPASSTPSMVPSPKAARVTEALSASSAPGPTPSAPSAAAPSMARAAENAASPPRAALAPPAPSSSASDPHAALFAEAHRLHFTEHDPARALAAWDRYLDAAPNGRFAPEARYNRALALVRLGRRTEAQQELAAFSNGMYGEYRRADAKALFDALARDASSP